MEKDNIIDQLKDFYRESYRLVNKGDVHGLRELYMQTSRKFAQNIPVTYFGLQHLHSIRVRYPNIIIAANHITTPSFFPITDEDFLSELGLERETLDWQQIQPLILRHYPLVCLAIGFGYTPAVVSSEDPTILGKFNAGWGSILIPQMGGNRLKYLKDQIKEYRAERRGLIIFPEGQDSPDYPPENYYRLEEFKSGFAVVAHDFAFPVIPVSMTFNMNVLSYTVRVNEPLLPPHDDIEYVRKTSKNRVEQGIRQNLAVLSISRVSVSNI